MVRRHYLKLSTVSLFFIPSLLFSQEWKLINTIDLGETPSSFSADTQGNFYLGFSNGKLLKYDSEGKELLNYSLNNFSRITSIEAINSLKIFLFYFDNQQITILDRFNTVPKNYQLSNLGIDFGMMACPTPDNMFWVLENNPQRLLKMDLSRSSLVMEIQTQLGDSVRTMRAFQNVLMISDEFGLHIFDQFGGKLHTISSVSTSFLQVSADLVIAYSKGKIFEIDPFSGEIIQEFIIHLQDASFMLKLDANYLFVLGEKLFIYTN